ncbi:MAG: ATP-binding protein [Deltaproteobacteria bacterium]|nr:ATP-binding protein [Deltaproteobacteria bacterium]
MMKRALEPRLLDELADSPAVALLGPRQSGKTTLALEVAKTRPSIYLDLESPPDRARLAEPEAFLSAHQEELVILDEVHRVPGLFPVLRGLIDKARRKGKKHGLYLLLGSAGLDLLSQSGETLAGRISYLELGPLQLRETGASSLDTLWLRGGFPDSFSARSDAASLRWRQNFIRTYLERDIPMFGPRMPAETLRRLWTMLAHLQGGLLNLADLARGLGIDVRTTARYLDLLVDLLLVRRLPPWHANVSKRLVRSPRIYVRDTGLVHALLDIVDTDALLGHPVVGASFESFAIENMAAAARPTATCHFYRTSGGAEIDLLLAWPDGSLWAVEVKRSLAPTLEKGFHFALADLSPKRRFVVYPGKERWPLADGIEVVGLHELCSEVARAARSR